MLYKLFLVLCLLLPFQVALNPSEGVDLASGRVFILLLFFLWLAESLKNRKLTLKRNLQTGLVFSFLFLSLFSLFAAQNTEWSIRKLVFLFSIFPIYFVGAYVLNSQKRLVSTFKLLVCSGFLAALIGVIQFFSQFIFSLERVYGFWAGYVILPFLGKNFSEAVLQNPSWLVNISGETYLRATATFPDPHMFSFFLGLLIPLALALFISQEKKTVYGVSLIILFVADLLTFSRGGYLGILAGFIFFCIFFWKRMAKKVKIAIGGIIFLMGFLVIIPNPISQRYASIFNLSEGSNKGRLEIWQKALVVIEKAPWLGVGIGNYPLEIKPTATYREPFYAHSTYLDIAAETGIPNALIWVGILFISLAAFIKKAKKQIIFLGPALGLIIFATHSLVETAIYSPVVLALFLIILSSSNLELKNENSIS